MTGRALIVQGDALELPLPDASIHAVVCDPPYSLSFMGRKWDSFGGPQAFQAWCEQWATEALRVLKPGGWLLSFGGTRTWHRLACAIEDAGFEMRDTKANFSPNYGPLAWVYGAGFPKSLDVDRAIDIELCQQPGRHYARTLPPEDRRRPDDHVCPDTPEGTAWAGFGTAAKPAWEPVIVARKPLAGNVAQNVLAYGTGALNIDATRIGMAEGDRVAWNTTHSAAGNKSEGWRRPWMDDPDEFNRRARQSVEKTNASGRWPSNVTLVHSAGCEPTGTRKIRGSKQADRHKELTSKGYPGGGLGQRRSDDHPWVDRKPPDYTDPDGMEEVTAWACEEDCPVRLLDQQSGERPGHLRDTAGGKRHAGNTYAQDAYSRTYERTQRQAYADQGGASRFYATFQAESRLFYTAKAPGKERVTVDGEGHPTVKPLALMRWLCRLVCPPGGTILDMFAGSGTTGEAAMLEGFHCILIDKDPANLPSMRVRTHPYVRRSKVITNGQAGPEQGSLL